MREAMRILACAAGVMLSAASNAGTHVWTSIGYWTPDGEHSTYIERNFEDITARAQLEWSNSPYSLSAASEAGHGFILARAAAVSATPGNLGHFMNNVYVDWLTLSRPDLAGQGGQLKLSFYYDNEFVATADTPSQANTSVQWYAYGDGASSEVSETFNAGYWQSHTRYQYIDDASGVSQSPVGFDEHYLTLTLNFTWGEPICFGYGIASQGQAVDDASYSVDHIGYFAGILEATAEGVAISDYALSSQSGTDYSHATLPVPEVPEPTTLALLAAGFGVFGLRHASRRRAQRAGTRAI